MSRQQAVRRTLHRPEHRWRRPRPVPPERDSEEQTEEKRERLEGVLRMSEEAGSFFPGRDQAGDQPQGGLLLDAQGEAEASEDSGNRPQGVG